jgi:hypothetical protein
LEALEVDTGFPVYTFDTLRHDSAKDVDHDRDAFGLIDYLRLTRDHEAPIGVTALQTAGLLIEVGDEVLARAAGRRQPTAWRTSPYGPSGRRSVPRG